MQNSALDSYGNNHVTYKIHCTALFVKCMNCAYLSASLSLGFYYYLAQILIHDKTRLSNQTGYVLCEQSMWQI